MKRIRWISAASLLTGAMGLACLSNVQGNEPQGTKNQKMTTEETISGRVKELVKNDHGDIDGLLMASGSTVHFPPHHGVAVAKLVSPGDRIEVRGHEHVLPKGEVIFEARRIESGGESIDIDRPRPPRGPKPPRGPRREREQETPMQATGTIQAFMTNPHGDVDGLRLSDDTEVKFPPHQGDSLHALAKAGDEVRVEGRRHETPRGDIHLHADRIVATASGRVLERDEPHRGRPAPPHEEILHELRKLRRLIETRLK
jgi:hypothetical protein